MTTAMFPLTLDSSRDTSTTSIIPAVPYPTPPAASPTYELIPHRVFVGGFASATTESDIRLFFEKFGHVREAKVIRNPEGTSKGYGFVTFDTEEEAQKVRNLASENLELKGRRLNLGPAMRKVQHNSKYNDFSVATPHHVAAYQTAGATAFPYPSAGVTVVPAEGYAVATPTQYQPVLLVQQNSPYAASYAYSPVTPSTAPYIQDARYVYGGQQGSPVYRATYTPPSGEKNSGSPGKQLASAGGYGGSDSSLQKSQQTGAQQQTRQDGVATPTSQAAIYQPVTPGTPANAGAAPQYRWTAATPQQQQLAYQTNAAAYNAAYQQQTQAAVSPYYSYASTPVHMQQQPTTPYAYYQQQTPMQTAVAGDTADMTHYSQMVSPTQLYQQHHYYAAGNDVATAVDAQQPQQHVYQQQYEMQQQAVYVAAAESGAPPHQQYYYYVRQPAYAQPDVPPQQQVAPDMQTGAPYRGGTPKRTGAPAVDEQSTPKAEAFAAAGDANRQHRPGQHDIDTTPKAPPHHQQAYGAGGGWGDERRAGGLPPPPRRRLLQDESTRGGGSKRLPNDPITPERRWMQQSQQMRRGGMRAAVSLPASPAMCGGGPFSQTPQHQQMRSPLARAGGQQMATQRFYNQQQQHTVASGRGSPRKSVVSLTQQMNQVSMSGGGRQQQAAAPFVSSSPTQKTLASPYNGTTNGLGLLGVEVASGRGSPRKSVVSLTQQMNQVSMSGGGRQQQAAAPFVSSSPTQKTLASLYNACKSSGGGSSSAGGVTVSLSSGGQAQFVDGAVVPGVNAPLAAATPPSTPPPPPHNQHQGQ